MVNAAAQAFAQDAAGFPHFGKSGVGVQFFEIGVADGVCAQGDEGVLG